MRPHAYLYSDVLACCYVGSALWLHNHCADVINQNGRPLDNVARLQCIQQVCWSFLPPSNLHAVHNSGKVITTRTLKEMPLHSCRTLKS